MIRQAKARTGLAAPLALALVVGFAPAPASAQSFPWSSGSAQTEAPADSAAARGARTQYGVREGTCDRGLLSGALSTSRSNVLGSAIGGAAGGLLGNQFGKGSGNTMATILGVVAGAVVGGAVGRSMDPVDQNCVGQALEHSPTDRTVAWQNPDQKSEYKVTPTKTYKAHGTYCRDYTTQAYIDGKEETVQGTACRQPDGSWKPQG
jgi:surface antigen